MPTIQDIGDYLVSIAPQALAEDWDNVGLLVGDPSQAAKRIMTCLTVTPQSAEEAVSERADLVITHHPLPFRPLKQLTTATLPGRLLLQLIRAGVGIYSCHTAFDSAAEGINVALAQGLGLSDIQPLIVSTEIPELGSGRCGLLSPALSLADLAARVKSFLKISGLHYVGTPEQLITKVAVACGSAGQFLAQTRALNCDLLVTGETNFHTCVEAQAEGIAMLLPGHFASEQFAMANLASQLSGQFPECTVWASRTERDPVEWA